MVKQCCDMRWRSGCEDRLKVIQRSWWRRPSGLGNLASRLDARPSITACTQYLVPVWDAKDHSVARGGYRSAVSRTEPSAPKPPLGPSAFLPRSAIQVEP